MTLPRSRLALTSLAVAAAAFAVAGCDSGNVSAATSALPLNVPNATTGVTSANQAAGATPGLTSTTPSYSVLPPPTSDTLAIKNFAYAPATLTVVRGATVTVHNEDSAPHTVTATGPATGLFHTGRIPAGGTATFRAPSKPGIYPFYCTLQPFMHGTLIVR